LKLTVSQVAVAVKQLNELIVQRRIDDAKRGDKPRNQPRGRRLGLAKEKPLPFPGKTKPIMLSAIDEHWLELHPENQTTRLIHGYIKREPDDLQDTAGFADSEQGFEEAEDEFEDEGVIDPALRETYASETFHKDDFVDEEGETEGSNDS
jgi:hypothetical protein